MSVRLGEALVNGGVISEDQLAAGLSRQSHYGGRLGSNMVQLGYLTEESLSSVLGKLLLHPCAGKAELRNVDSSIVSLFPAEIARKYEAVPFRKEGDQLGVAMAAPQNQQAIAEICLHSKCRIKTYIAPEIVVREALEQYYPEPAATAPPEAAPADEPPIQHDLASEVRYLGSTKATTGMSLADISREFAAADNFTAVANILMQHIASCFARVALFRIEGGVSVGWKTTGFGDSTHNIFRMRIPLDQLSLMRTAVETRLPFCGSPTALSSMDRRFFDMAGGEMPKEVLLYPISSGNGMALLFYADNAGLPLGENLSWVTGLLEKTSIALQMVSIKSQLLSD